MATQMGNMDMIQTLSGLGAGLNISHINGTIALLSADPGGDVDSSGVISTLSADVNIVQVYMSLLLLRSKRKKKKSQTDDRRYYKEKTFSVHSSQITDTSVFGFDCYDMHA